MNIDTYAYATAKISKWLTESILFSFMHGSKHSEELPNIVVLRICKNNNKLLIIEAKSLKNICEGTTFSPSLVFCPDFKYTFFFPEHLSGPVKSRDLPGFALPLLPPLRPAIILKHVILNQDLRIHLRLSTILKPSKKSVWSNFFDM